MNNDGGGRKTRQILLHEKDRQCCLPAHEIGAATEVHSKGSFASN